MPIHFIPNDPRARDDLPMRRQNARGNRPRGRAAFSFTGGIPEDVYDPGTTEFLFWQCREAALAALETWELIASPLVNWQGGRTLIPLQYDHGAIQNARYDRDTISFWQGELGGRLIQFGASTDAVVHEIGHAVLDAIRPDFWSTMYVEAAAFHEAFADCLALLVAFSDAPSRETLLAGRSKLREANFLEAVAEDVADALRTEAGPRHPHSSPRHAFNTFKWKIPFRLSAGGPPAILSKEPHSFGRVFTGCFYDTICNIFDKQPQQSPRDLLNAAIIAGRLLVAGVVNAKEVMRFFQEVGRQMIHADTTQNGGRYHLAIRDAFADHAIALGSASLLAPTAGLAGAAPSFDDAGESARLSSAGRSHLMKRIGAPRRARLTLTPRRVGETVVVHAVHKRQVSLGGICRALRGVHAPAAESVSIGCDGEHAVLLGETPNGEDVTQEARQFVETLLERGALLMPASRGEPTGRNRSRQVGVHTHTVRRRGDRKILTRMRFSCGAGTSQA